ncbi:hypothetical protein DV451_002914 [Geotrichum candidum]|uniref:TPR-like protein n=1 Tax=Geotrichum candidum TaxID=1173061 RepID=A0A9P5KTR5_GEOCN|nr:hypothetical protein DV451_002914 [Geotrichum candidum]
MSDLFRSHVDLLVFDQTQISDKLPTGFAKDILAAKYDGILSDPTLKPLFSISVESVVDPAAETVVKASYKSLVEAAVNALEDGSDKSDQFYSLLIFAAIANLHLFIQSNFTGPALEIDPYQTTLASVDGNSESVQLFNDACVEELTSDGEPAYTLTSYPHLLILSNTILSHVSAASHSLNAIAKWWYSRSLLIYQSILNGAAASLHLPIFTSLSVKTLEAITEPFANETGDESKPPLSALLTTRFYSELARAQLQYDYDAKAEHSLKLAQQSSGLQYALTGCKAKRTKFQQKETSQMVFIAKSRIDKKAEHDDDDSLPPPISLELNSDLLLEKVQYTAPSEDAANESTIPEELKKIDPNHQPSLQDIDNSIVLLRQSYIKSSSPYNNPLVQEELMAIANRIINSPPGTVNWCLYSRALWERSVLESSSAKTVERGTLQMQSLVEELGQSTTGTFISRSKEDKSGNISERLAYIHQLLPLPKWAMDARLAEKFLSIGVLKSALEVYERLAMWDQVALCYAAVGQEEKGQKVLEEYLEKHPKNARAWSILGEITENPEYFEKSWEVGRYPSARRSLGQFYYNPPKHAKVERNLELAIKYLNDALTINPLHHRTWFLYGCAGLETEQYDLAAEAFTRCVALDETDGKSWSNLSTALLRLDKKNEAFNALKRAVRVTSEKKNWRIWNNYVTVAVELSDWNEVLHGTRELISIEGKQNEDSLDVPVLEHLCHILVSTKYPEDESDKSATETGAPRLDFFQKSALDLFTNTLPGLITAKARLWKIVARVELWRNRPWAALDAYEKGFRIYTHLPTLESDEKVWDDAVEYCSDLVDAYTNLGPREGKFGEGSVVCSNWKFKAKSTVRLLIGRGKKWWEDTKGWERLQEIKEEIV